MKTAILLRRLAASVLLVLAVAVSLAPPARADAVSDARTALVAGEFSTAKTLLDPVLAAQPANGEAAVLRALARVGLAVESRAPAFATKLGATSAVVDIGSDTFDIVFKETLSYETTTPLTLANGAYRVPSVTNGPYPSISFENRAATSATLVLAADFGTLQNRPLSLGLQINDDNVGYLFVDAFGVHAWGDEDQVVYDFENRRFTLRIPAGAAATLEFHNAPSDASFSLVGTRPSTLVVLNGKRVDEAYPKLTPTANFTWILTLLAQLDTETLAPVVADLAVPASGFQMSFASDETGSAQDIIVAYADTQLLLAEIKTFQAFRRLFDSYNLSQTIPPVLFSENGPETLLRNTALLTPKTASATLNAQRAAARTLFKEALRHYAHASDDGVWTRGEPPAGGAYLFALEDEDPAVIEEKKVGFETALAQFETALDGPTPLAELSDRLAADPAIPDGAGLSLAPLFGVPALNLRGIVPAVGENGILRGGSTKLLASGLFPGLGTAAWEEYIASAGLADLATPARQTGPAIQRQPSPLTTVAEGASATLALVAECYPAPTYQWYKRDGSVYEAIPGATAPALAFPEVSRADAGLYLCKVTNHRLIPPRTTPTIATISSVPAKLVVTYPPEIVTPPAPVARYTGKPVTLTVAAVGVPAPRYQWYRGETAVTTSRSTPTYTFNASAARAGLYHVVVTNDRGSVASEPVAVDVHTKPVFTTQPVAQNVPLGSLAYFTVVAVGNPEPRIKWRKDGKDIPGATGPTLTINQASLADRGVYTAVASNTVRTGPTGTAVLNTVSTGARLTVTAPVSGGLVLTPVNPGEVAPVVDN